MFQTLRKLAIPLVALLSVGFFLFLINQVSSIFILASSLNPVFGKIVLITLSIVLLGLTVSPVIVWLRLPKPIKFPKNETELAGYKRRLVRRLQSNALLQAEGLVPSTTEDLPQALEILNSAADKVVKSTAQTVFLTTAISQNGKLDAITVLVIQLKMVWRIAHIYYQRPTIRELLYLYGNVGASSFLATQIEEIDLTKHIEPIVTAIVRNTSTRSVPVVGQATTVIMDSLMEGTTNAFLSLRVGILAKNYCGQVKVITSSEIRKNTLKEAGVALGKIAISSSGDIITAIIRASRNASIDTLKSGWNNVKKTGGRVKDSVLQASRKISPF